MEEFWKKTLSFGLGVFDFTKEKVEKLVDEMIKRGELSSQEGSRAVEELLEKAEKEQTAFWIKIREFVQRIVSEMSLVRRSDFKSLEERVADLEKRLQELNLPPRPPSID
ncbi:phasin family protein [Desulfobacca acetoxidans]|uniref:Polyhydroxyalkanoate synthesis regulator n=1 Tax=Desulfobacca acetoxidans (strain ATCC 700848 / DSM 11109 / ASRB2) TaxID=880072 RepID=F2NHQ5_DESAR|nr:hypothetical protein [Desulfobacca acetoxidans]AEB09390.1 hypothetical protein Desac_1535 [Desulfobacca acetoxidans DSM 11109]HAY20807.1 polyhydroxyalkanoate synthesis regulator [Desulfobacterales bacterium]